MGVMIIQFIGINFVNPTVPRIYNYKSPGDHLYSLAGGLALGRFYFQMEDYAKVTPF
jgi:hypothetical protein